MLLGAETRIQWSNSSLGDYVSFTVYDHPFVMPPAASGVFVIPEPVMEMWDAETFPGAHSVTPLLNPGASVLTAFYVSRGFTTTVAYSAANGFQASDVHATEIASDETNVWMLVASFAALGVISFGAGYGPRKILRMFETVSTIVDR